MSTHPYTRLFILPSPPTVDEDASEGYEVGDVVISGGSIYDCTDNTEGAAVWEERGSGGAAVWGDITGTLSDQTDLQTALNAKLGDAPSDGSIYGRQNASWTLVNITAAQLSEILHALTAAAISSSDELFFWDDTSNSLKKRTFANIKTDIITGHEHGYASVFGAPGDPTASDDNTEGYNEGDIWYTATKVFIARDMTTGAAVWDQVLSVVSAAATYAPIAKGVTNGDSHDHNGGDGAQIAYSSLSGALTQAAGTWSPTGVAVINVDGVTDFTANYVRLGSMVICSGQIGIDPSAAGATTRVRLDLPIASNFTATNHCIGTVSDGAGGEGIVRADTTNDEAELFFTSAAATNRNFFYMFMYQIL